MNIPQSIGTSLLVFCVSVALKADTTAPAGTRQHDSFDQNWKFHLGDATGAEQSSFADQNWRSLDLPHDWSIEGPYDEHAPTGGSGGYLPTGLGWYRKTFSLSENVRGKSVSIEFDGVYQHSTVWLNGHELGTRPYGYSTFSYDLTPYLNFGPSINVIAVRVDNSAQPNSRWYSGSGIYRHTRLTITDPVHIALNGVYVTSSEISAESATVHIKTRFKNNRTASLSFSLSTSILNSHGQPLSEPASSNVSNGNPESLASGEIAAGAEQDSETPLKVLTPRLWSPESPELYRTRTELRVDGTLVDAVETTFGIRSLDYDVNRGLLLNGTPVKLRGVCIHHDAGAVGAAVPEAVLERRLKLLQEMGCNAIRCSHNPMAPEFYDLCDRLGLLVMDEAFDEWTVRKPQIKYGYSDVFAEWSERDLVSFIHRDRNHPSVIMWSAGNEIGEQWDEKGPEILRKLVDVFHREDPTRPVTAAMDNIFNQHGQAPVAFSDLLDIVGYNYVNRWGSRRETQYADDRYLFPKRKFVGTENVSVRGIRGEYGFGPSLGGGFSGGQIVPGYGPEIALYTNSALQAASLWRFVATHDYVIGDFAWTGIDYLGESRWPLKLSTAGAFDTCGFKKDSFYFYQSQWTKTPMVHLLPHWNWPGRVGKTVPVVVYTNCAAIELFLNGRSLGAKALEFPAQGTADSWNTYAQPVIRATTSDLQLTWDVPYEPGELKAVGYDRTGVVVTESKIHSAGVATTIELAVDRASIGADGRDVAHVTVRAVDANGVLVPLADNAITFSLSGSGKIIGLDNGNPASHESYQGKTRRLFNGLALAMIQSTPNAGTVKLTAQAEGLREASIEITTQPIP